MKLNFPSYELSLRRDGERIQIFDVIRKRWMVLTPEEWVRQHLIWYLREERGVPASLMSVEKGLKVNGISKRIDLAVYNRAGSPVLLCECKRPEIALDEKVFEQIFVYNLPLGVSFLLVTNGLRHLFGRMIPGTEDFEFLEDLPGFEELI